MIFELNYDNQAKEILEGQRRYREQMQDEINKQAATIAKLQEELQKYKNKN
ncbi:hypothetical protein [Butyrivibrio sp. INlla21]|uniref:hypothetical protein n=1 Tax=Butyrivibrio sp. INlla21 TaxID=1520811 RepID=UPI000AF85EF4|nr:hypothetical protein [Butyrivibrio sp. INlla21]